MSLLLSIDPSEAFESKEFDPFGMTLDSSEVKVCVLLPYSCTFSEENIQLHGRVYSDVPLSRFHGVADSKRRVKLLASIMQGIAFKELPNRHKWNVFRPEYLRIDKNMEIPADVDQRTRVSEISISDELLAELKSVASRIEQAISEFERAKAYLLDNANCLSGNPSKAMRAAGVIRDYMLLDAHPFMHSWNREKSANLVSYVKDLSQRKQATHPGFRHAVNGLSSILHRVEAPSEWEGEPNVGRFVD